MGNQVHSKIVLSFLVSKQKLQTVIFMIQSRGIQEAGVTALVLSDLTI